MFLMTLVPDHTSLLTAKTFFKFMHGKSDFSGLVFFSELDGTFGEVWEYRKGVRSRQLAAIPLTALSGEELQGLEEYASLQLSPGVRTYPLTRSGEESSYRCDMCEMLNSPCLIHKTQELETVVVTPNVYVVWENRMQ